MTDTDDVPTLPADTMRLLAEFQAERDAREKSFQELKDGAEKDFDKFGGKLSMDLFGEDWNASQFWYSDETAQSLARQLLQGSNATSCIAVVSAPSVYVQLRNILYNEYTLANRPRLCLLEFDKRFEVLGSDFVYYDFQHPLRLPDDLKGVFDRVICDPPYLSEDCQTKTALSVRFLAKTWAPSSNTTGSLRFITCTGERMSDIIHKVYVKIGVRMTDFEPRHSKGLSNEFRCYSNFECPDWRWQQH